MKSNAGTLPKRVFIALERVFTAEIRGHLFQSKARIYTTLAAEWYAEQVTETYGAGTRFPVTCTGYVLTHKGRYAYCSQCKTDAESEESA